jgi:hypothetical protein
MNLLEVKKFIQDALECSVYLAPREPGLTYEEIVEVGKKIGLLPGEIGDALSHVVTQHFGRGSKYLLPDQQTTMLWQFFLPQEPEYRNFNAFDFVVAELNALARAEGAAKAQLERAIVVKRAVSQGISRNDIEAAITIQVMSGQLAEKNGLVRFPHSCSSRPLPSEQLNGQLRSHVQRRELLARLHPLVKDVIERRTDGRPKYTEPLDAFPEELDRLGYRPFRLWWKQTVGELRRADTESSPVSVTVLAAALVEGALTFVVRHARELNLAVFRSSDFARDPRTWRIDDLISSAAPGSDAAILDAPTKNRAETLIRARHRIHAGRMLSAFPGGVPDLRPEEARDAKATADLVVRRVLEWLEKYPPPVGNPPKPAA